MEVLLYPDPRLKAVAEPIDTIDDEVRRIATEMVRTMHEHRGIGLAGNQVGYLRRLIVINPEGDPEGDRVLANPKIEASRGATSSEEGCLSFPKMYGRVSRAEWVRATARDLDGKEVVIESDGLLAIVLQHEIDHLDGILFVSRMSPADQVKLKRGLKELEEKAKSGARGLPADRAR
jgi:peptide deformylase